MTDCRHLLTGHCRNCSLLPGTVVVTGKSALQLPYIAFCCGSKHRQLESSLPVSAAPQVSSVSVSATFTVMSGKVTTLGWMFREDIYAAVRVHLDPCM